MKPGVSPPSRETHHQQDVRVPVSTLQQHRLGPHASTHTPQLFDKYSKLKVSSCPRDFLSSLASCLLYEEVIEGTTRGMQTMC